VANTWTELTALDVYAMATNGKELQNPWFSLVGNFEKATTYVFAGRLIRIRRSTLGNRTLYCNKPWSKDEG